MSCLKKEPQPLSLLLRIPSAYSFANNLVRKFTSAKTVFLKREIRNGDFSFRSAGFEMLADIPWGEFKRK